MEDNNLFFIGEAVATCTFTNLPILKISQVEKTFYYNDRVYLPARVLRAEDNVYKITDENTYVIVVTLSGFILSIEKKYLEREPVSKIDAFLKGHEYSYVSQRLKPYNGKLEKNEEDGTWFIPHSV